MNIKLLYAGIMMLGSFNAAYAQPGVSIELAAKRKALISKIFYNIFLNIPNLTAEHIQASEEISFTLANTDADLLIDFKETTNHLKAITVNQKSIPIIYKNEHIIIDKNFLVRGINSIKIKFIAGEIALNRKPEFLYSLLVPEKARTFFPCFDQPDMKAQFTLTAAVPDDWEAITNGSVKSTSMEGNKKIFSFNTSDTISTYLFSVVAGKFKRATKYFDNKQINFYYRETDSAKINLSIDTIFFLHQKALQFLEDYTNIPYPFKKFDFIAIPDFQYGGMEHAGAIDYKASILFLDKTATLRQKIDRAHVIAHETAHMWFGNLVTMKWFNDVWMKEVFANFMGDKFDHIIFPENNSDFQFLLSNTPAAYSVDRTMGTHPIRQQLYNLNQAGLLYGSIIYYKAPIAMKQLEKAVGEIYFKKGIREYLKNYAFENADWPQLIPILEEASGKDLSTWNNNWINKGGRPVLTYAIDSSAGMITKFTLSQKGENNIKGLWKQFFSLAFIYSDSIKLIPVSLDGESISVKEAEGLKLPSFILFNALGDGYGLFPVDEKMFSQLNKLQEPLMRASACINLYENVLSGQSISPQQLLRFYQKQFDKENEELILSRMKNQFINIYWQFISPKEREQISLEAEQDILQAIEHTASLAKKRILFQLYTAIALSKEATEQLFNAWQTKLGPGAIDLSEDDLEGLAGELAVRQHPLTDSILATELQRTKDKDRYQRLQYLLTPLSNDTTVRDKYFASLSIEKNRANEDWVIGGLAYLHHPLRTAYSEKYLPKTLELLEAVQSTGGIFFSTDWLSESLAFYQSKSAASIVKTFLQKHPKYNINLKRKILQEADDLFRAEKIISAEKSSE